MNRSPQSPDATRREAAAEWNVRLEGADASEADWLAFEAWLSDPENRQAMSELESALALVEDNRQAMSGAFPAATSADNVVPFKSLAAALRKPAAWAGVAAAAAAILVVFVLTPKAHQETYVASAEATRIVDFPDGTSIRLNRGALVRVRMTASERQVELDRGEASFQVAHNPSRPFVVTVGEDSIRDVGTDFNVMRGNDRLVVAVREGSVQVSPRGGQPVSLVAGDRLLLDRRTGIAEVSRTNAGDAFAWQDGRLVYHDASLSEVVEDLNRYGNRPVTIADPDAARLRFSGVLVIDTPAAMAQRLQGFLPVDSEETATGTVLRSRSIP